MREDNYKTAKECFREVRITDELRPAPIKKYESSIRNFLELLWSKNLTDLNNSDFDYFESKNLNLGLGILVIPNPSSSDNPGVPS